MAVTHERVAHGGQQPKEAEVRRRCPIREEKGEKVESEASTGRGAARAKGRREEGHHDNEQRRVEQPQRHCRHEPVIVRAAEHHGRYCQARDGA